MGWMAAISFFVAWKISYDLANKWKRGGMAIVAALLGIAGTFVAMFGVAAAMHFGNPSPSGAGDIVVTALVTSCFSLFISPIAAFLGWRNSKGNNNSSGVVETIYSDERDDLAPELENNEEAQRVDTESDGKI